MDSLVSNLTQTLPGAVSGLIEKKQSQKNEESENQALPFLKGVHNPKLREALLEGNEKAKLAQQTNAQGEQAAQVIIQEFGPTAGKIFKSIPTGAQTIYFESLLQDKQRRENIEDQLGMPRGSIPPEGFGIAGLDNEPMQGQMQAQTQQAFGNDPFQPKQPNQQMQAQQALGLDNFNMFSGSEPMREQEAIQETQPKLPKGKLPVGRTLKEQVKDREREEEHQFKIKEKKFENLNKRDEKTIEEIGEAPGKAIARGSLNTMIDSILTGQQDPFSSADWARLTNVKAWETPGAAAAATGSKEFLINSLNAIRGRPNIFLETQVSKSLPETGLPRDANASKARVVKFGIDATDEYEKIVNDLIESEKYPPGKLKITAQKKFREWEDGEQDKLLKDLKSIREHNYRSLGEDRYIDERKKKIEKLGPGYILVDFPDGKIDAWKENVPLPKGAKKV